MKKLFIILCLILLAGNAHALGAGIAGAVGGGVAATNGAIGTIVHTAATFQYYSTIAYHSKFTPTTAGPVNYCHVYLTGAATNTLCLSIHSSDGTRLGYGAVTVSDPQTSNWQNVTLDTPVTLTGSTTYYVAIQTNNSLPADSGYEDNTAGPSNYYFTVNPYSCGANITPEANAFHTNAAFTVKCDNTSSSPE